VVVYARSPDKIPLDLREHALVKVIRGSLEDTNLIRQAFSVEGGIDAVVSALGPPVTGFHPKDAPIARAYERVIEVMKEKGVKRIIVLGTASIADDLDRFDLKFKAMVTTYANFFIFVPTQRYKPSQTSLTCIPSVATFAPYAYHDVIEIGRIFATLANDDVDWTIARVPILTNSNQQHYRAGYIGEHTTGYTLSREGFGRFVLDELVNKGWVKKRPMVSSV